MHTTLKYVAAVIILCCSVNLSFGQQRGVPSFDHALNTGNSTAAAVRSARTFSAAPETLKILAAMVEFAPDNDGRTTGDGRFVLTPSAKKLVDPPPHNKSYFQQHITFLQNYFRKVSNGNCIIRGTVLDSVYKLALPMQRYSPSRSSATNIELGNLMNDAWHTVDSVTPGIPFNQYNVFVIFHAGVGRDVDLVSLYGYDPAPFDLPSIYLSLSGLKKMFGESYNGVPVSNGTTLIPNSILLPETEVRELQAIGGTVTLQLGINGLFAASIGSHLGLPDLFNTKNGRSGIGRFGLMDGQSIFSWGGLFPPEPSAWEKQFLGWIHPTVVPTGEAVYTLPAVGLNTEPDSVYNVPISAKEYFLVENRNRDANRDGSTITLMRNDSVIQRTWYRDTTNFNAFDQDSLYGVVIDVDEFDWSLPGGVNTRTGEWFDGGTLVWHIDESVIDAQYATNTVNANIDRRGVDLEEADGAQDIGESYEFLSAGSGTEDGTPFDFWYEGNSARSPRIYGGNQFSMVTIPNSMSNGGANSHAAMSEFSLRAPRMTAKIKVGDSDVKFLPGFPKNIDRIVGRNSVYVEDINADGVRDIITVTRAQKPISVNKSSSDSMTYSLAYAWKNDGNPILPSYRSSGLVSIFPPGPSGFSSAPVDIDRSFVLSDVNRDANPELCVSYTQYIHPDPSSTVGYVSTNAWSFTDVDNDSLSDKLFSRDDLTPVTSPLLRTDSFLVAGVLNGIISFFNFDTSRVKIVSADDNRTNDIVGVSLFPRSLSVVAVDSSGLIAILDPSGVTLSKTLSSSVHSPAVAATISNPLGKQMIVVGTVDGKVHALDPNLNAIPGFPFSTFGIIKNSPSLADIDGDGQRDIIVFSGNKIFAINTSGAVLDNFPIVTPTSTTLLTSPIVADIDGNGNVDIIAVTQEGLVVAYDKTGNMVRGFPLLAGPNSGSTPAAFYLPSPCLSCIDIGLAVASDDGHVYAWRTGGMGTGPGNPPEMPWPQYLHDAQNTGLVETALTVVPKSTQFFPTSMTYNWPNPVGAKDNYRTHIRYYVGDDATVTIKIFDMAGDLVKEFVNLAARGGLDNEIEWDVTNVQSGIYYAHIDAQGTAQRGTSVIKIAVIK